MVSSALSNWSSTGSLASHCRFERDGEALNITVRPAANDRFAISIADSTIDIDLHQHNEHEATMTVDGATTSAYYNIPDARRLQLVMNGRSSTWTDTLGQVASTDDAASGGQVHAVMHGLLLEVLVASGDEVAEGDKLCVLEAMKMQHEVRAGSAGTVTDIHFETGNQVSAGALILEISPEDER